MAFIAAAAASEWLEGRGDGVSPRYGWFIVPDTERIGVDDMGGLEGGSELRSGGIMAT